MQNGSVKSADRFFFLDVIRFLAIFYVTGFHAARFIGFDNLQSFSRIFKNMFISGGWLGCCLFFFLSGYCLCINYNEKTKYFDFIRHRLIKILPAYYAAIVVWYFLVKMGIAVKPVDLSAVLSHVFLVHTFSDANFYSVSGVFWFLGVLFNFYLLFPFLYKMKTKKYLLEISTIIIFTLSVFIAAYFHIKSSVFTKSVLINLPCFVFGIILYKNKIPDFFYNRCTKGILLAAMLVLLVFTKNTKFLNTPIQMLAITESCMIGFLCVLYKNELEKLHVLIKNFIVQIALASYSIYLYNYIFYATNPIGKGAAYIYIYIYIVFGFGICMYLTIEKPLNNLIKNFKRIK